MDCRKGFIGRRGRRNKDNLLRGNMHKSKTKTAGHKNVTTQLLDTPFGKMKVSITVCGYKSSEGDIVYEPPAEKDELDGAEEHAVESE